MTLKQNANNKTTATRNCPPFRNLNRTQQQIMLMIAKFGYINKKLYLNHMDNISQAYKYRVWSELEKYNLITNYKSYDGFKNYFYLTRRGSSVMLDIGIVPVSKMHPIYFEHDNVVMKFVMVFMADHLIKENWVNDAALKTYSNFKIYELLKTDKIKLPDLVFEMNVQKQKLVVALEVERSSKSQARYDLMVLGYLRAKGVDLVLVVHKNKYIKKAVTHAMTRICYPQLQRPIAFIDYNDFYKDPKAAILKLGDGQIALEKYFKNIQRLCADQGEFQVENQSTNHSPKTEAA